MPEKVTAIINLLQAAIIIRDTELVKLIEQKSMELSEHMCLVGPPNPYKLEQSWELTFLIGLTLLNTKLASKNFFTDIL